MAERERNYAMTRAEVQRVREERLRFRRALARLVATHRPGPPWEGITERWRRAAEARAAAAALLAEVPE